MFGGREKREELERRVASHANSRNQISSYLSGVVRPGEYWMLESIVGPGTGFLATFTPLV
ncbi:MAG: hypothetical protein JJE52_04090 [Acidimicrobiia bacterium]|nr:hypothetical protein [Acidimicrobiia bacterium]